MPNPSYYFTLFKKFQLLGHAPSGSNHGAPGGLGGFDLTTPNDVFAGSNHGGLLGASTVPSASPLWAILNSRAMGNAGFTPINVGGVNWPTMPVGSPPGWNEFQVSAPVPKLVTVFGDWITAGKINDIPSGALGAMPPSIGSGLDASVVPFVCSMPGDNGVRPGSVPGNYWATSLIFIVDPATGATVNPSELAAASEYYLVAVVGNRGNTAGGRFASPAGETLETAGWVRVWNSGISPAVQLQALANLDMNAIDGIHEVYFLNPGRYDLVGFRMNIQTIFNGLVKAIGESGADLGGLTPTQWVHAQGAHLCAKVLIRRQSESWPTLGSTPLTERRIAQKNLAPFAIDLAVTDPDPAIHWRNFMVGDAIAFLSDAGRFDERFGRHRLLLRTELASRPFHLYLAVPLLSFERWLGKGAALQGLKLLENAAAAKLTPPFPRCVVLAMTGKEALIDLPPLGKEFLAMSLGIQYSAKMLQPGHLGNITMMQDTAAPKIDRARQCYEIEYIRVGGFTLEIAAEDSRRPPDWLRQT